jgi:Tn3 transposase DDE domain
MLAQSFNAGDITRAFGLSPAVGGGELHEAAVPAAMPEAPFRALNVGPGQVAQESIDLQPRLPDVHILDGLLNCSDIQPDTLHADTQGQSEPVFGLCRLLGIKLMPRMRGLSDVAFYRPAKSIRYAHIDTRCSPVTPIGT